MTSVGKILATLETATQAVAKARAARYGYDKTLDPVDLKVWLDKEATDPSTVSDVITVLTVLRENNLFGDVGRVVNIKRIEDTVAALIDPQPVGFYSVEKVNSILLGIVELLRKADSQT